MPHVVVVVERVHQLHHLLGLLALELQVILRKHRHFRRVRLDAGADDLQDDGDNWEVLSAPEAFTAVNDAVKGLGIEPASAQVSMIPQSYVKLDGKVAQQMLKLMDALDDQDDVQHVWSNFDISEKEMEASLA